jgi:predicted Rdx family selenoprotein
LAEQILHDHIDKVSEVRLIPSSGGVHEVTYGSTVLHSKKETGKHPDPDDVLAKLAG